jgi:hypothetical protein
MDLPPHDPGEPFISPPGDTRLVQPVAVFIRQPNRETQRLAGAILMARPGVLFIV